MRTGVLQIAAWALGVGLLLSVAVPPATAQESEVDEYFEQLADQLDELEAKFWEDYENGHYDAARTTAEQLLRLGRKNAEKYPDAPTPGMNCMANVHLADGNLADAERLFQDVLSIKRREYGEESVDYAWALKNVGFLRFRQGRYSEAVRLYEQALERIAAELDEDSYDYVYVLPNLADAYEYLGQHSRSVELYERVIQWYRDNDAADDVETVEYLRSLAHLYRVTSQFEKAEATARQAIALLEANGLEDEFSAAYVWLGLAVIQIDRERYDEALRFAIRGHKIVASRLGDDHIDLIDPLDTLARSQACVGNYVEAERLGKQALALAEKYRGPGSIQAADEMALLANFYSSLGRFLEAETLLTRAIKIFEANRSDQYGGAADAYVQLGWLYTQNGRYAEAESALLRARAIYSSAMGPQSRQTADVQLQLGHMYLAQSRHDEAEAQFIAARSIYVETSGDDALMVADCDHALAEVYCLRQEHARAEKLARSVLSRYEMHPSANVDWYLNTYVLLANAVAAHDRYDEAAPLYAQSLEQVEKRFGPNNPMLTYVLLSQAEALVELDRGNEAEPLLDRVIVLMERAGVAAAWRSNAYFLRARLLWTDQRRSEALADLRRAMDLADEQRVMLGGSERERAASFGEYAEVFEQMVDWQVELGDVSEALLAIERGKARSLLEELSQAGADLTLGLTSDQRQQLRSREDELKQQVAVLETQLKNLGNQPDNAAQRTELEAELASARDALYRHYRDARSANPVYRGLVSTSAGPPRLSQIERSLVGDDGLMLVYLLGKHNGFVVSIGQGRPRLLRLQVDEAAAKVLEIEPGPLTGEQLQKALMNDRRSGVLQQLADAGRSSKVGDRLTALWKLLVPAELRELLVQGQLKQLIVVPDGPLALVPFEALVVEPGPPARYLLDVGPPIHYAPSASVMFNLRQRALATNQPVAEPVLTVGNPVYPAPAANTIASRGDGNGAAFDPGTRYTRSGGQLTALPMSGTESQWVAEIFRRYGKPSLGLRAEQATEANLREQIAGRQIVHLACHGLTDHAHGNFFGALALSPGDPAVPDPRDDGFLTFGEIYELDLGACELAILSACETNYGPEQRGEGVWGLSRSFLVAGARRTVASNWLVDDEAAASLVSYFCGGIAQADAREETETDYALALHNAKRWVRSQAKWSDPYYWATFVLVGPR